MRAVKGKFKKYWKYVAWTQPVLSSNTSSSEMQVSATNEGQGAAWKAFDGNESTHCATSNNVTTQKITVTFAQRIYISQVVVVGLSNQYGHTNSITINGETKSFNYSVSNKVTFDFSSYFGTNILEISGTGTTWVGIFEIYITAYTIEPASEEDYDFYTEDKFALPMQVERSYWKYETTGQTLETTSDWNSVGSNNGYFGSDASVHSAYQGAYSDTFTFTEPQNAGEVTFTFYGDKQFNFRLSYYIYATINGSEVSVYSDSSSYQNGSDIHGWKTITFDVPSDYTALRIYTTFGRVNSTYCFGGLGKYQMVNEKTIIVPGTSSDYDYYTYHTIFKAFGDN